MRGIRPPWRTTLAPILISFSRKLVNDQCSTSFGNTSVRTWLLADVQRARSLCPLVTRNGHSKRFLHILGIHGDPVAAKQKMDVAKRTGNRIANLYGYDRAFKFLPSTEDKVWLREQAARITGADSFVLDPTAGGGSIPFEAERLGLSTISNELNPDDPRALSAAGLSGRRWSGTPNTGRPTRTQPKSVSQKRPNMLVRPSNMPLDRSAPRNQPAVHQFWPNRLHV